jgi:putative membrane protein
VAVAVLCVACACCYGWGVHRTRTWPLRRTVSFGAGLLCVLVATLSPIDSGDERYLSDHMIQHLLLIDAAPLLLLCGTPVLLAFRALPTRGRQRLAVTLRRTGTLTHPLVGLGLLYLVLLGTHVPAVFDFVNRHDVVHEAEHGVYLACGLLLWWPLHDGDPSPGHRLGGLARLIYAMAAMLPADVIGAWLNRAPTVVYSVYLHQPHPVYDQQQAGAIMWVAGTVFMAGAGIWSCLHRLVEDERRQRAREARLAA